MVGIDIRRERERKGGTRFSVHVYLYVCVCICGRVNRFPGSVVRCRVFDCTKDYAAAAVRAVPTCVCACVQGGSHIKAIREQTGADVTVEKSMSGSQDRIVILSASPVPR